MLENFVHIFLFSFFTLGFIFIGVAIINRSNWGGEGLITAIILTVIFSVGVGIINCGYGANNDKNWNNGLCPNCEIEWELKSVSSGGRYNQFESYYYTCPECNTIIEIEK